MTASYTGMNPEGTGALTDHDQLWQSVTKILTTPTSSRVMRREFGSAIPDLLDAPQNAVTRMQLMGAAALALAQWEPRISLTTVNVVFSETGAVTAELSGTITETMTETSNTIRLRS
ncbi:GPW/gp25 family protein [Klebsiella oxytoca]|uniref:GPW/gp25 family protein n=1 Tax=Klebsiella oxytoca TaxID=571 RepID=UPI0025986806|nr:GPW/gp25 family protein [Klebsiella oxytoca]MDM4270898.1 GPW/gp25 family protein [Klebsiella oxytoca]